MVMMGAMRKWMEDCSGKWERMEESLKGIMRELEGMRKREEKWREERDRMEKRIEEKMGEGVEDKRRGEEWKGLEERVNKLEGKGKEKGEGEGNRDKEERIGKIERICDRKERQERRKNIMVKEYKEDGRELKSRIGEIFKKIGAEVEIDGIREIKTGREDWGGLAVVSLKSEGDRREVLRKKKGLKGENIWIEEDLTWKERQSRWKLNEVARVEERRGARIFIGNNKVDEEWWRIVVLG